MEPRLVHTAFSDTLVKCNGLDRLGFEHWLFFPGMLFNAVERWWGDGGDRNRPHEGLDLCLYRDSSGKVKSIGPGTQIPVMYTGEIVAIRGDFLGQSVYVHHGDPGGKGLQLYTIYGHVITDKNVRPGRVLDEGDVFATIADTVPKRVRAPAHLHVSIVWVVESIRAESLDWNIVTDPELAVLLDPLEVITCDYSVLESG